MNEDHPNYKAYCDLLNNELVCAMGCTEPIAIAYCAAKARSVLGAIPDRVEIKASGNMIKNTKSVVVPNTGGRRGIDAAAAAGILGGDETSGLQVLAGVSKETVRALPEYLKNTPFHIQPFRTEYLLDIEITVYRKDASASVRIAGEHTNIVHIEKDGEVVFDKPCDPGDPDREGTTGLNLEDIYDFACTCRLEDIASCLENQIKCNWAIAREGLRGEYGSSIGRMLLDTCGDSPRMKARAYAAAGSDARMNGCEMPVVINSGSGNQGITVSVPVLVYAESLNASHEKTLRALALANLISLHEKAGIGRLSAYCGAVSAGAAAGAGIAFLYDASFEEISNTVINALAVDAGIICDGAKSSCAGKISLAVEAGITGFEMSRAGKSFPGGDGLVSASAETSLDRFSRLGRIGMQGTDEEIIKMMTTEQEK